MLDASLFSMPFAIAMTGGVEGLRDEGALDSALNAAVQGFGDAEFYPTAVSKIARMTYGIIRIGLEIANGSMDATQLLSFILERTI